MHSAPQLSEKYLYKESNRLQIYVVGFISTCILLTGNIFFVYYNPAFWAYAIFISITGFYLMLSYMVGFMGEDFDFSRHQRLIAKWLDRVDDCTVDIYLPVCKEPLDIIHNTWKSVWNLKTAYAGARVYVLDDGKQDEVKALAKQFGFNYIRRETNELKKAGNLRNAFKQTSGEYILILDADFVPRTDMLSDMLPYMFEYPDTAIVQSPQYFTVSDHSTWVGKGAASVQELFYRLMQVNRNTFNGAICVGTCALYRRKALEPFGGTAPIEYSEDVHTGFQLISTGWRIEYIPIILSKGICPDELKSFFTQQMRWSLGSISLFFSKKFWVAPISIMQRVCYLNGMFYYMATGISVLFSWMPSILVLIFIPEKMHWYNLLFSVPSLLFSTLFMWYWMKSDFGLYVLRSRAVSYYAHFIALKDFLFGTLEEWIPTGAKNNSKKYEDFKYLWTMFALGPQCILCLLITVRLYQGYAPLNFVMLIGFLVFNAALIIPATITMLKDKPVDKATPTLANSSPI